MRQEQIIAELRARLPQILPVEKVKWEFEKQVAKLRLDAMASVRLKGVRLVLGIEVLAQPNLASVSDVILRLHGQRDEKAGYLPILVAPSLGLEARRLCKQRRQAYLDLSGNVWIDFGPILIEKEVPKSLYPHEAKNRSPFADKASLLLRYLLDRPDHSGRVREVAESAGLSPGYVSKLVRAAEKLNYVSIDSNGLCKLRNIRELLGDWSSSYNWHKNEVEWFFVLPNQVAPLDHALGRAMAGRIDYALSLHAGNNLIEPYAQSDIWHIYAGSDEVVRQLKKALPVEPVAREVGNIVLMHPYYRHSVFYGVRNAKGFRVVSDLQLYLDLKHYPVRGFEAAEVILARRLAPAWNLKDA